jgi:hypothetical protein
VTIRIGSGVGLIDGWKSVDDGLQVSDHELVYANVELSSRSEPIERKAHFLAQGVPGYMLKRKTYSVSGNDAEYWNDHLVLP